MFKLIWDNKSNIEKNVEFLFLFGIYLVWKTFIQY